MIAFSKCRMSWFVGVLVFVAVFDSTTRTTFQVNAFNTAPKRLVVDVAKNKQNQNSRSFQKASSSPLFARYRQQRPYYEDDDDSSGGGGAQRERQVDRPTQTTTEIIGPSIIPSKPKIVVLGATGKIGRLVVQQLLNTNLDITVVALVRNYDKACQVLYEDDEGSNLVKRSSSNKKGPQLQIVEGDLVPPEELPGYVENAEEDMLWKETAESATRFYKETKVEDYDNRDMLPDINEALSDAVRGCTTIISCVGAVRPTNVWSDLIAIPFWRLFRKDVSSWCRDGRHPYYVHYASTRKVLGFAESEQRRREAAAIAQFEDTDDLLDMPQVPKIRIVRISDLCVSYKPWNFVPIVTNTIQSMVFRYQNMAEQLLEESKFLETIVLRPGDLVDEPRNVNTTTLQVDSSGVVPSPARIGRADVASMAVAATLFQTDPKGNKGKGKKSSIIYENEHNGEQIPPFHYTLGMRWASQDLKPYPPQGQKSDGLSDAQQCMNQVLKVERRKEKRKNRMELRNIDDPIAVKLSQHLRRRTKALKPYGICVAIPTYFILGLMFTTMARTIIPHIPGAHRLTPFVSRLRNMIATILMRHMPQNIAVPRQIRLLTNLFSALPMAKRVAPTSYISL